MTTETGGAVGSDPVASGPVASGPVATGPRVAGGSAAGTVAPAVPGSSGLPWARWRPSPYLLVSAVVVLGLAVIAARRPWIGDFGLHAAAVERLRTDLLHPGNPQVAADTPSPYFSPYTLLLAVAARLTGISAVTALTVAAPFCVALLLYGLRRFVAVFTDSRWAPVLVLGFVPLLWGPDIPAWSGFLALRGIPLITPYPSTVAMAVMLLCWATLDAALTRASVWRWVLVGGLGVLTVLVHPFTGACTALGALALLLGWRRRLDRTHLRGLAAGLVLALAVALSWPYFSVLEVLSAAQDFDAIHAALYRDPLRWYGLGLAVGVPAVLVRLRRERLDPLVMLFGATLLVVLFGGVTGRFALGRVWPVVMLSAQVTLAVEVVRLSPWRLLRRPGAAAPPAAPGPPAPPAASRLPGQTRLAQAAATLTVLLVAVACVAGLVFQYGNLLLALPKDRLTAQFRSEHRVSWPADYRWVERRVASGDVVLTSSRGAARLLLRDGARFVTPPWPDPFLPDERQRRADEATLLSPTTPATRRRELLDRYGVRWLLDVSGTATWADDYAREVVDGPGRRRLIRLR